MEEERPFLEEVLDFALYAPIGLALTVAEDLPALVEKGRTRVGRQLGAAKFVSRIALRTARRRFEDLLEPTSTGATVTELRSRPAASAPTATAARTSSPRSGEGLAIPGYDALAASQVVARLDALTREELEAVERHELGTRRRRTILSRIAQLKG